MPKDLIRDASRRAKVARQKKELAKAGARLLRGEFAPPLTPGRILASLNDEKAPSERSHTTPAVDLLSLVPDDEKTLLVIGGGTAALTWLYTADIPDQLKHVVLIGERGYWSMAAHRLAQPHHILSLPHKKSEKFIDPAAHDADHGILPHEPQSAYVHSHDYQRKLHELETAVVSRMAKEGRSFIAQRGTKVTSIQRSCARRTANAGFDFYIEGHPEALFADRIIVATGAGPARKLSTDLEDMLLAECTGPREHEDASSRILSYNDILSPKAERCRGKRVLVYGGGATAAWAMEVADLVGTPVAWAARNSFEQALIAGPRVGAIIEKSKHLQEISAITHLEYVKTADSNFVKVTLTPKTGEPRTVEVDYIVNCIGQDQYELGQGGLPEVFSDRIRAELKPLCDKDDTAGLGSKCMLGWSSDCGDIMVIGAAQGTFHDSSRTVERPASPSKFIPRSGQVPITIGGVTSTVYALTNYMPFFQNPDSGKVRLESLNLQVMNATQLAVYFTAAYPDASPELIDKAVTEFIARRKETEFGLNDYQTVSFMVEVFGQLPQEAIEDDPLAPPTAIEINP